MSSMASRKKADLTSVELLDLDDLRSKEASAKAVEDALEAEASALAQRLEEPLADDTAETLAQVDNKLSGVRARWALAKRDYKSASAARAAAEADVLLAEDRRRRHELQVRLDEALRTMPAIYKRQAQELLATVADLHRLDQEIAEYNNSRPRDVEILPTFEQAVRWTAKTHPVPLSAVFEIPALQFGDKDYRVPGTLAPNGIWIDVNGVPRQ